MRASINIKKGIFIQQANIKFKITRNLKSKSKSTKVIPNKLNKIQVQMENKSKREFKKSNEIEEEI